MDILVDNLFIDRESTQQCQKIPGYLIRSTARANVEDLKDIKRDEGAPTIKTVIDLLYEKSKKNNWSISDYSSLQNSLNEITQERNVTQKINDLENQSDSGASIKSGSSSDTSVTSQSDKFRMISSMDCLNYLKKKSTREKGWGKEIIIFCNNRNDL